MKNSKMVFIIIFGMIIFDGFWGTKVNACTTAIISPAASENGTPMLWKNRDTDYLSNKVVYVKEVPYSYVGLVNEKDTSGRIVYAGLNSEGFGIMNSVAYNLPEKSREMKDLEGMIMAEALRTCRTVTDFENFIRENLGESLGSWANFGVIDGEGNAFIFEVHNHGYEKFNTADTPEKYMINSNFSRSGVEGKGAGYLRFERASYLFKKIPVGKIASQYIFEKISRDFGNALLEQPSLDDLSSLTSKKFWWVNARDSINRVSTASAIVICGRNPSNKKSIATFWVLLGEPVTSIAVPVWVESGTTPKPLFEGQSASICEEALRIKKKIHPYSESDKEQYMLISILDNKEKTGFLPGILKIEKEIYLETQEFLKVDHTTEELVVFQEKMAQKALNALKEIK